MAKHTTIEGTQIDLTEQLGKEFGRFYSNPNSVNWQRMSLAMIAYQQAKLGYRDASFFLHDMEKLDVVKIEQYYELHIVDSKAQ